MNRIESRPAHQGLWQYAFFIDFEGHVEDAPVRAALAAEIDDPFADRAGAGLLSGRQCLDPVAVL
jgi:hypothetical protein